MEGQYRFFVPFSLLSRNTRDGKLCGHDTRSWWRFKGLSTFWHLSTNRGDNENSLLMIEQSRAFLNNRIVNITLHFSRFFANSKNLHQYYLDVTSKMNLSIFIRITVSTNYYRLRNITNYKTKQNLFKYFEIFNSISLHHRKFNKITLSNLSINYLKEILFAVRKTIQKKTKHIQNIYIYIKWCCRCDQRAMIY